MSNKNNIKVIIAAADSTPKAMAGKERLKLKFKVMAIRAPVQAPVPGRGTATKSQSPINKAVLIRATFFSPRDRIHRKGTPNFSNPAKQKRTLRPYTSKKGMGKRFPIIENMTDRV